MLTHADNKQENKNQSLTKTVSQKHSTVESTFQFVDNRPEVITQRSLHHIANNSPQAKEAAQLQAMADNYSAQQQQPIQKKKNNTGLPDKLKTGMENLSGILLDNVKVFRNSDKPAQLQAHAYAQGNEIHLGPGQEKHLPHEAWHVVQQKQGRVRPTLQLSGQLNVNEDKGLETEADLMGAKAPQVQLKTQFLTEGNRSAANSIQQKSEGIIQRVLVDGLGIALSQPEIIRFMQQYPGQTNELQQCRDNINSFVVNEFARRGYVTIVPYAPSSNRGFHYSLPQGFSTSSTISDRTNREAAKSVGMGMNLSRTDFRSKFTDEMLQSGQSSPYKGYDKMSSGMSLSGAGLDRTHHLSDSSIRIIVQWLHENRPQWQFFGFNWVKNWVQALTGGQGTNEILTVLSGQSGNPTVRQLNGVVDQLSNNPRNVGFGDSHTNQRVVGPFFDSSKTPTGFDSPVAVGISMATEGLRHIGLPNEILEAALAEVKDESDKKVSSMVYFMPPADEHPFSKGPFGGGNGFGGGGGFGGGSFMQGLVK